MENQEIIAKHMRQVATRSYVVGAAIGLVLGFIAGCLVGYQMGSPTTVVIPFSEGVET